MAQAHGYKHSVAFAKLKRIHETIPGNLTSVEYLKTLDGLLENAIFPVLVSTRFVDTFICKILAWQSTNPKRKTTSEGKKDLPSYIVLFLLSNTPEQKLKVYQRIVFDRGITMEILRRWMELMERYVELKNIPEPTVEELKETKRILFAVHGSEEDYPYGAYLQTKYWYEQAVYFKSIIMEKYTRLCLKTAQQDYVRLQHRIDLEDIMQEYLMAASKAIDKCDANRGVLTTHIQNWLLSAKNVVMKRYLDNNGQPSQSLSEGHKFVDDMLSTESKAVDLQVESIEERLERNGTIERVRQVARCFDPTGYGRLVMGVSEHMTAKMSAKLHSLRVIKTQTVK